MDTGEETYSIDSENCLQEYIKTTIYDNESSPIELSSRTKETDQPTALAGDGPNNVESSPSLIITQLREMLQQEKEKNVCLMNEVQKIIDRNRAFEIEQLNKEIENENAKLQESLELKKQQQIAKDKVFFKKFIQKKHSHHD